MSEWEIASASTLTNNTIHELKTGVRIRKSLFNYSMIHQNYVFNHVTKTMNSGINLCCKNPLSGFKKQCCAKRTFVDDLFYFI